MKSIEERKLALISQIQQLKAELDSLKQQDYREPQLGTDTGRMAYASPTDLVESFSRKGK